MNTFAKLCCFRRLHPDLVARVSQVTFSRNAQILDRFCAFVTDSNRQDADTVEQLEDLVCEFRDDVGLAKSQHTNLIAAIIFAVPRLKGQLVDSKQAIKGRNCAELTNHTVPFTKGCANLFASHMAVSNKPRMGAGLVIQTATGLRPSELLNMFEQHVHVPPSSEENIVIRLGAIVSTKAKREQFVLVRPELHKEAHMLLKRSKANTAVGARIFSILILGVQSYDIVY